MPTSEALASTRQYSGIVILRESIFFSAVLYRTELMNCNLSRAKGITEGQFAGAILSGTLLPDGFSFSAVKSVEDSSKLARNIFLFLLGISAFFVINLNELTASTLLFGNKFMKVPFLNAEAHPIHFIYVLTIIITLQYLYLHVYLQRLWSDLGRLPAIFPNDLDLEHNTFPWLLSSMIHYFSIHLRKKADAINYWQIGFSLFTAWLIGPLVLIWAWYNTLVRHDKVLTGFILLTLFLVLLCGLFFLRKASEAFEVGNSAKPVKLGGIMGGFLFLLPTIFSIWVICLPNPSLLSSRMTGLLAWRKRRLPRSQRTGPPRMLSSNKFWGEWRR